MNNALEKILTIMEDGSIENTLQALELALSLGLEDEVLKKIPPLSYRPSDINIHKLGGLKNLPKPIIRKLYNEALAGLHAKPIYMTQLKTPDDIWIFEKLLYNIAENPNTPKDILIELASYNEVLTIDGDNHYDHGPKVRFYLSLNKNLPEEALMILVNDTVEDIRERAKQKLGGGIMKESKLVLSHKDIRRIIKEELDAFLSHPIARMMKKILSATMTANYQTIMKTFEENARTLHVERSALGRHKGSHKKQLLDMLADAMYTYQKSYGADGLEQLIKIAEDVKFEYETHDERGMQEEPPF